MNKMIIRVIIFLVINFAALGIGGLFTSKGVASDWYQNLNKAPWTPPGWVFGAAWTVIMIGFAIYMAYLWPLIESKKRTIILFTIQLILNVLWNPIFFKFHNIAFGLIVITALTFLIGFFISYYYPVLKKKSALLIPYILWLIIATSLNAYIFIEN